MCVGHMMHMMHMKFGKGFFKQDGGRERLSTHGVRTPSTACGRFPSLEEGGLGASPVKAFGLSVDWI